MSREELGDRWGHTTLWRGAPAETFREGYIPPLRLSKKVCLPLGPLCEGAPPAGGGGENCAVVRNISGSDCQKMYFCLAACVGATIGRPPAYRSNAFFGTVSCKENGHGRAMLAPTRVFRQSAAAPHFRCPLCRTGVYFSLLTKAVSLCYLVIG